jgi:hypothetical protein
MRVLRDGAAVDVTLLDALSEILRLRRLVNGKITIHLLAADTNQVGTQVEWHATRGDLLLSQLDLTVSEEGDPDEHERIKALLDAGQYDEAEEAMDNYRDPLSTFATEEAEIDLAKLRKDQESAADKEKLRGTAV